MCTPGRVWEVVGSANLVFRNTLSFQRFGFARIAPRYPPGPDGPDAHVWQIFFYDSGGTEGPGQWRDMDNTHEVEQAYVSWDRKKDAGEPTAECKVRGKDGREFSINFDECKRVPRFFVIGWQGECRRLHSAIQRFQSFVAILSHEVD